MKTPLSILLAFTLMVPPCGAANIAALLGGSPPAASAYLLEDNFETGSAPSGWTVSSGWTWNISSPTLQGSFCGRSQGFGTLTAWKAFTAQSTCYYYFLFQTADGTPSSAQFIAQLRNSSDAAVVSIVLNTDGTLSVRGAGAPGSTTVGTLSDNTNYHVWVSYTKGTGANAQASVGFSTNGVRPTSGNNYASLTNGNATTDAERAYINGLSGLNIAAYYDRVLVSSSVIGDNP